MMNKTSARLVAYLASLRWDHAQAVRCGTRSSADYFAQEVASVTRACKALGVPDWLLGRVARAVRDVVTCAFVVLPDAEFILGWWREGADASAA